MTTNYQSGHDAEKLAANYLIKHKYKIRQLNWKTRYCEIDIVAEKSKTIYFVEVKSRSNNNFGGGLEYVTPKKLQQMGFAAEMWVSTNSWDGDYQLAAIEVDSSKQIVTNFLTEF